MSNTELELKKLHTEIIKNNTINKTYYEQFDVKRGLRNADGSGVLAGLTSISSVIGSTKTEKGLEPTEGVLTYRGISLKDIVDSCHETETHHFERVCFLLLVGRYPTKEEASTFNHYMAEHRNLPEAIIDIINRLPSKNIMNKLQTCISALYGYDKTPDDLEPTESFLKSIRVIAKLGSIVAYSYLAAFKQNPILATPEQDMSHAESFLYMLYEGKKPEPFESYIVDLALVLHAEHGGGNNSTFTTYVVSSSGSDIYSSLAAAVASLKGPLHGAANKKVMEMMFDIKTNVKDWKNTTELTQYLIQLIEKKSGDKSGKLYGLGHAVYTKSDPRAIAIKSVAKKIAEKSSRTDEYNLYNKIAEIGPETFQNIKKSDKVISPNVDFYSGFVYDCLSIPQAIYTPLFAMARSSGWCSHRIEENLSGKRIIRPGYKYVKP